MVRYMVSVGWNGLFRSALVAFEAYGAALVGIAAIEPRFNNTHGILHTQFRSVRRRWIV